MDNQKQVREYKKELFKFLVFYCKANPKFYHRRVLVLSDDGREKELGTLLRNAWLKNNPSIRFDRIGFIDNSLYLEALVRNLLGEIPRIYSDDEGYEDMLSSSDDEEDEEEDKDNKSVQGIEEEGKVDESNDARQNSSAAIEDTSQQSKIKAACISKKKKKEEIGVENPQKRRKISMK